MALTSGDGPNRGRSAPSPRPLPKKTASTDRLSREFTQRIAERNVVNKPRNVSEAIAAGSYQVGFSNQGRHGTPSRLEFVGLPKQYDAHLPVRGPLVADMARAEGTRKAQASRTADMYSNMAARQKQDEKRLAREKQDRSETDSVLTESEWLALTPLQQAAAQANFDLDAAIKKDFADQTKHTANSSQKEGGTERVQGYMKKVEELFGPDGASTFKGLQFAPNTLAFLESRGIDTKDELGGKTLDDIVSGDALIDEETFASLGEKNPAGAGSARGRNVAFAQRLAQGQLNYQEKIASQLKRGDALLSDVTQRATNTQAGTSYGANALPVSAKMTAVRPETVAQIGKYMEILARPDIDLAEGLDTVSLDLKQLGANDEEQEQVWASLLERSRQATTGEAGWFDEVDFEMRTPIQVAQALGATTLKRAGAK